MQVRSLGFSTDLMVLQAEGSSIVDHGEHLIIQTAQEPDYWWGNFVLVAGPDHIEQGLEAFRREFPNAHHTAVGVDGTDGELVSPMVEALGLEPEVSVVLTAATLAPAAVLNAQVHVLSSEEDWQGLFELRRQDDHLGADASFQRGRVAAAKHLTDAGKGLFLGAFRGGELVSALGIVSDGSGTARFQHVQTHLAYRRQGLASHLISAAAAIAQRRWTLDRLVIVADPAGPAIGLYRALGFEQAELQVQLAGSAKWSSRTQLRPPAARRSANRDAER